ncbi:serine hydrolase [Phenylobacterium sp. J367]|uniref:serine hydrolase domain-containing protein n=1 Tax=Phenylobacterium sp. J367 TaxID=2898435 RepID=UPI0021510A87|nr:serine hydrolase domain-containing protein [Phenylobacterium sp. J367]MCR5879174.1 beta-lactamase family protein [Phenylobacterium sp. J367]
MGLDHELAEAIEDVVTAGQLAGAVALVWRDGALAGQAAVGWRDLESDTPMTRDTIFRIASLTKPVTAVAAMTLWEEGRFGLDEPIAERWAPEFAQMRVLASPDGPLEDTTPAERPITFRDLLTHRSGISYGDFHAGPIGGAYREALGPDIDSPVPPEAWIAALARLPLIDQPGAGFHYGASLDLLGFLLARMDGRPLGEVLKARVFDRLGMADTGFVPADRGRTATLYGFDDDGRLTPYVGASDGPFYPERPADMEYVSGGAGLWSTAEDYLRFARLFLEGGAPLLKPDTVALMSENQLTPEQRARGELLGLPAFEGHGFGFGLAVVMDPAKAPATRCQGGIGTVGWPGAFGGWWQADPTDGSAMVFLAHNHLELAQLSRGVGLAVYDAILQVHAVGSRRERKV